MLILKEQVISIKKGHNVGGYDDMSITLQHTQVKDMGR